MSKRDHQCRASGANDVQHNSSKYRKSTGRNSISKKPATKTLETIRLVWPWVFFAILLVATFSIASKQMNDVNFISLRSVQGVLEYTTQILLIGLAETFVIIAAGIDLSVGWTLGFSSVIAAEIMQRLHAAGDPPVETIGTGLSGRRADRHCAGTRERSAGCQGKSAIVYRHTGHGNSGGGAALLISGGYPVAKQPPYLGAVGQRLCGAYWPGHGVLFFFNMPTKKPSQAD